MCTIGKEDKNKIGTQIPIGLPHSSSIFTICMSFKRNGSFCVRTSLNIAYVLSSFPHNLLVSFIAITLIIIIIKNKNQELKIGSEIKVMFLQI
jgi:hypothetical protein